MSDPKHVGIVDTNFKTALNVLKHKSPGMVHPCKGIRG
jgi:hypothetical protein